MRKILTLFSQQACLALKGHCSNQLGLSLASLTRITSSQEVCKNQVSHLSIISGSQNYMLLAQERETIKALAPEWQVSSQGYKLQKRNRGFIVRI